MDYKLMFVLALVLVISLLVLGLQSSAADVLKILGTTLAGLVGFLARRRPAANGRQRRSQRTPVRRTARK